MSISLLHAVSFAVQYTAEQQVTDKTNINSFLVFAGNTADEDRV